MRQFIQQNIIFITVASVITILSLLKIHNAHASTLNCYDYGSSIECTDEKGRSSTGWKFGNNTEWTHPNGKTSSCWKYGSNNTECTNSDGSTSSGWSYGPNNTEWSHSNGKSTSCWRYGRMTECTTR